MKLDRLLATALAVGAFASLAGAARAATPPPPEGDAAGIELARKVNAHYSAEPRMGVESRSTMQGVAVRTHLLLVRGKLRALISRAGSGRAQAATAITRRGFHLRAPGERCWTKLGPGAPGIDELMVPMENARFLAPEPIGALTRLEVVLRDPASRARTRLVFKVDAATGRIATQITEGIVMNLKTLPRAPVIPSLRPVCRD